VWCQTHQDSLIDKPDLIVLRNALYGIRLTKVINKLDTIALSNGKGVCISSLRPCLVPNSLRVVDKT